MAYRKGDVVLVPFPFTDLSSSRVRPAVVVNASVFGLETRDVILAMVTSQRYSGSTDCEIQDWREAGLVYPSWVRAKLATIDERLVQFSPGRLSERDTTGVEGRLRVALGLKGT